jgi:G:T-mismatch repair DNA endonuclease (very short patch repair protein)
MKRGRGGSILARHEHVGDEVVLSDTRKVSLLKCPDDSILSLQSPYLWQEINIPRQPDPAFPMSTAVAIVQGCFRHRHAKCHFTTIPITPPKFWKEKFDRNVALDKRFRDA